MSDPAANGHDLGAKHEPPCPCTERRVRVVFPSGQSRLVWRAVTAGIALWMGWLTTRIETRLGHPPGHQQDNLVCQCLMDKPK